MNMKIKRYLLALAAAAGLVAACETPEMVQMNISDAVAPVMHDITVGEAVNEMVITSANQTTKVTFTWDAADFGVKTQVNYSVEAAVGEGNKFVLLSGLTDTKGEQTLEGLNQVLYADMGLIEGELTDVNFYVGAKVGEAQKIYSSPVVVKVSVTAAEKQYPKLSVAGSYNGWVHNTQYLFDFAGEDKVYQAVIDFGEEHSANEFKITGGAWGKDEHSMDGAHEPESKTVKLVAGGGDNINVYQAKRYYHLTFNRNLTLTADVSFDQIGVIGGFNGWGADVVMTFNPSKQRFYADVEFTEDTEFKFRLDGDWAVSYGSTGSGVLDSGDNIKASAGNYRIYLNMNNFEEMTYELNEKMYGKDEPVGGTTEPEEPETPVELKGWGLVGEFSGWADGKDIMLASDGTYLVAKGVALEGQFKFRKDGGWDVNLGAPGDVEPFELTANTETELTAGGKNLTIAAGTYDVYLDEANSKVWFINDGSYPGGADAPEASEWGIVGQVNGWAAPDITMYKTATEGLFVAYNVAMPDGGFKIRANGEWNDAANYGLPTAGAVEVDHAYDLICGGNSGDMTLVAGNYDIWFDLTNSKVYIMTPGKPISEAEGGKVDAPVDPATLDWYLVGQFNGWSTAAADYKLTKSADGKWFEFKGFVADGQGFKFHAAGDDPWAVNRGAEGEAEPVELTAGVATAVIAGGKNMALAAGTYDIYMNAACDKAYFMAEGEVPEEIATKYAEYIYVPGNHQGWAPATAPALRSPEKDGVYTGFCYFGGDFKFTHARDWNNGEYNSTNFETFAEGFSPSTDGTNITAPAGYYFVTVNIPEKKLEAKQVSWGIIGTATANGWDADQDMAWDAEKKCWTATLALSAGEMKFRSNDNWDAPDLGGSIEDLVLGGGNIAVEAGTYAIELYTERTTTDKIYCTMTKQ